jgi:CDP-diacylglycerol--glycerol-3-phosphate 3-phosphatidyltransferase
VFFRGEPIALVLGLLAIGGSFMVSYGSAKAEALRVPVPEGIMRRAERAVCLSVGATLVPLAGKLVDRWGLPAIVEFAPILLALLVIAVFANVSAVRRLRAIAALAPAPVPTSHPSPRLPDVVTPAPSLTRHIATPEPKPPVFSADAE